MAKNKGRPPAVRAARTSETGKVAEIQSRGWGIKNLSRKATHRLLVIGISAVLAPAAAYTQLLTFATIDWAGFIRISNKTHTYWSREVSDVAATAGPLVTILLIGWLLISLSDIARRRTRPIAATNVLTLSSVSLILWLAIVLLQFMAGVIPGNPFFYGARSLIVLPVIVFALGTMSPVVWSIIRRFRNCRGIQ